MRATYDLVFKFVLYRSNHIKSFYEKKKILFEYLSICHLQFVSSNLDNIQSSSALPRNPRFLIIPKEIRRRGGRESIPRNNFPREKFQVQIYVSFRRRSFLRRLSLPRYFVSLAVEWIAIGRWKHSIGECQTAHRTNETHYAAAAYSQVVVSLS